MSHGNVALRQAAFGQTARRDAWWVQPLVVFLVFSGFVVYSTWIAFNGNSSYFYSGNGTHYLAPFYSPVLFDAPGVTSGHAWFGPAPSWWPRWKWFPTFSPALLILWVPAGFRFTCYYYRGAYYKAFWADPPSCGVGEPGFRGTRYRGEQKWPLRIQNVHRYLLYFALAFIAIFAYDAARAFIFTDPGTGQARFGVGMGSIILLANAILLGGYTMGCHSLRHLVGGGIDRLSGRPVRQRAYGCVSCLNRGHMKWAWVSLFWVAFADIYVRLCATGVWHDWRIL
jgi:hypothetical protein